MGIAQDSIHTCYTHNMLKTQHIMLYTGHVKYTCYIHTCYTHMLETHVMHTTYYTHNLLNNITCYVIHMTCYIHMLYIHTLYTQHVRNTCYTHNMLYTQHVK